MKTLFTNARVLTMSHGPLLENVNVLVEGTTITYVGEEKKDADKVIDCKNYILMPGLKNAHTHSAMVFVKGVGEGLHLAEWLEEIYKREATLTPERVKTYTTECIKDYLQGGTTAFFDMYFYPWSIAEAADEAGIRLTNLLMMENHPERIEMAKEEYKKWNYEDSIVKPVIGFHAEYTIGDGISNVKNAVEQLQSPCCTHLAETDEEVKGSAERRGCSPVQWLDNNDLFKYGGVGFHSIYLSKEDREIYKKKGLWAVPCMGSNIKLRDGIAPIDEYLKEGINVAIGTDGPASNLSISMWREMKLVNDFFPDISYFDILKLATVNGAKAMGWDNVTTLDVNMKADMILVDANDIESLVKYTYDEDVKLVYINGKNVFEREKF